MIQEIIANETEEKEKKEGEVVTSQRANEYASKNLFLYGQILLARETAIHVRHGTTSLHLGLDFDVNVIMFRLSASNRLISFIQSR